MSVSFPLVYDLAGIGWPVFTFANPPYLQYTKKYLSYRINIACLVMLIRMGQIRCENSLNCLAVNILISVALMSVKEA